MMIYKTQAVCGQPAKNVGEFWLPTPPITFAAQSQVHPYTGLAVVMLFFWRWIAVFWLCQAAPVTGCWEQGAPVFPCSPITPDTQKQPDFFAWIVKTKRSIVSMSLLVCLRWWTLGARKTGTSDFFSPKKPLNLWIRTTQWSCTCLFQA